MDNQELILQYIYIKQYGCLKETEFQFSRAFNFEYNKESNQIKAIEYENSLPEEFWDEKGRIIDIHAMVGNNGCGKTTFLRFIMDIFTQLYPPEKISEQQFMNEENIYSQAIIIMKEMQTSSYKILCIGMGKINVDAKVKERFEIITDYLQMRNLLKNIKLAFLSNVFDRRDYQFPKAEHISDYSFGGLLARDYFKQVLFQREDRYNDPINEQAFHDIYRQVSFMSECYSKWDASDQKKMFDSWPKVLHLRFIPRKRGSENTNILRFTASFQDVLWKLVSKEDIEASFDSAHGIPLDILAEKYIVFLVKDQSDEFENDAKRLKYRLCRETFQNLLLVDEFQSFYRMPEEERMGERLKPVVDAVYEAIKDTLNRKTNASRIMEKYPYLFFMILKEKLEKITADAQVKAIAKNYEEMFQVIFRLPDDLFLNMNDQGKFDFVIHGQSKQNMELFSQLLVCYKKIVLPYTFIEFDWGLSSGENNLLSMYSRLFAMRKVYQGTNFHMEQIENYVRRLSEEGQQEQSEFDSIPCKSLWLLIDEMDLTYHPGWQKKLIADMCYFIPKILPDEGLKIQIIFTTHSPILLGDIPKENVTYLKSGGGKIQAMRDFSKNTFGQNIYILFQDSFFLEDPIGQFSADKLQEILINIQELRQNIDIYLDQNNNKNKKRNKRVDAEPYLEKIRAMRKGSVLFGDRIIYYKIQELLDVCEYRLESYVLENEEIITDRNQKELAWMYKKKEYLERQIAELEKGKI